MWLVYSYLKIGLVVATIYVLWTTAIDLREKNPIQVSSTARMFGFAVIFWPFFALIEIMFIAFYLFLILGYLGERVIGAFSRR